ncbi:hypothetical protein [Domibacillus epiphyticus]|uniref:ECF transporter S component n=1 Tax=Domibacillus epiphyticus TaxID=1714355 RepID=A0A1V2AB07_9BACI|nr:hypothetical protein [Domibacillus epiphyticus]OMP68178.1 hypothetical protein BTO28_02630 [Domibacillus epiphyticus]
MKTNVYTITEVSLLAAMIAIIGSLKIPAGFPGSDFQLSAPLAVAIAAVFGFWRYMTAGIIASLLLMLLGIHNLLHVEISMVFRIVAGGIVALLGHSLPILVLAGPIGTAAARWVLSITVGLPFWPLVMQSLPGMIFTAVSVYPLYRMLRRVKKERGGTLVRRNV